MTALLTVFSEPSPTQPFARHTARSDRDTAAARFGGLRLAASAVPPHSHNPTNAPNHTPRCIPARHSNGRALALDASHVRSRTSPHPTRVPAVSNPFPTLPR
ncbi:hypothetical protein MFU01_18190 [Myxococcus fulvus]|uniref:Uncharacterized protein n=1 Tax=Myxococcus fulvus TaxID=33 RepID=A0A511SZA0_MYXFU|nr:hypothetical protein MFU01_18190 [Myxococcus fulvus]